MESNKSNFYLTGFMLNYDIVGQVGIADIDDLLNLIKDCSFIAPDLLIAKFFEYTQWLTINPNDAYEIFKNNFDIDVGVDVGIDVGIDIYKQPTKLEQITELEQTEPVDDFFVFLNIHGDKEIIFKPFIYGEVQQKVDYLMKNNLLGINPPNNNNDKPIEIKHNGMPLPDPVMGRPHLNWRICYYPNCGKVFSNPASLVNHLIECNAYTQGYHWAHEEALYCIISPDNVIKKNLTKCPAYACNQKDFNTPQELINHWTTLGIEPFWKKGMTFNTNTDIDTKTDTETSKREKEKDLLRQKKLMCSIPKLFVSDSCMICLDNSVEFILSPCRHHVYCFDCLKICSKESCPVCRTRVKNFIPYA